MSRLQDNILLIGAEQPIRSRQYEGIKNCSQHFAFCLNLFLSRKKYTIYICIRMYILKARKIWEWTTILSNLHKMHQVWELKSCIFPGNMWFSPTHNLFSIFLLGAKLVYEFVCPSLTQSLKGETIFVFVFWPVFSTTSLLWTVCPYYSWLFMGNSEQQ